MAFLRIPEEDRSIESFEEIRKYLAGIDIDYGTWKREYELAADASDQEILGAYGVEIETLKQQGGYVTADIINVSPATENLDVMLNKFNKEHWHDEDEVRFIIDGRGVFHLRPKAGPVVALEVEQGDFIRVPRGTLHWFDLCQDRKIKAIRLFQDPSGWTPHYTGSGVDKNFLEVCLGPAFIPPSEVSA
ncbi:MAG: cupin domain-containing protein [Bdellovibrionales bacterium]|nr:cupin domain-containing protein [Bdellovibrionales bacterium]